MTAVGTPGGPPFTEARWINGFDDVADRVVKLSSGEYEVHYIGVNWPHHNFNFNVVGAEQPSS